MISPGMSYLFPTLSAPNFLESPQPLASSTASLRVLICLAEYDGGDQIRVLLCCDEFHMECIDKWLKEKQGGR